MKKKIISVALVALMLFLLASCGQTKYASWQEAYASYLTDVIKENDICEDDYFISYFNLIYLNDDDIPELVLALDECHAAAAKLVVFKNSKAVELGEYGSYGSFDYLEKGGMLDSMYCGSGGEYHNVYSFDGKKPKLEWEGEKYESFTAESDYEESVIHYYSNGKAVSLEEYEQQYEKYLASDMKPTFDEIGKDYFIINENNIEKLRKMK